MAQLTTLRADLLQAGERIKQQSEVLSRRAELPADVSQALQDFAAILRHKNISPPMMPGVQEMMADKVAAIVQKYAP